MAGRLRDDLLRRLVLPMATVLLFSGGLSYHLAARFTDRSYDRAQLEDALALARQINLPPAGAPFTVSEAVVDVLQPGEGDRAYFQVRTRKLPYLGGDRDLVLPGDIDLSEPAFFDAKLRSAAVRVVVIRIPYPDLDDDGVLMLAETRLRRDALTGDIVAAVVAPQLALIFLAVVVIVGGVASGLQPLERLVRALEERSPETLAPLPIEGVPGEAVPLIQAFNRLLGRLAELLSAQQRFVADAAHQLRTPLAALRLQVEQIMRESDPERRSALFDGLRIAVDRSARLSGQLLLLARAEPGGGSRQLAAVDLSALTREIGSRWVPQALAQGRDLGFGPSPDHAAVIGDALMLEEMVSNLIDNALRYGGQRVTLRVERGVSPATWDIVVEDDGPGIPEAERSRVFERFHRVPGTGGEGSGLGLAIVKEIAQGHGATVGLEMPPEGGLRVRVGFLSEIR